MIVVNQRMEENTALHGDLGKQGGYFYMCGLAVAVMGIDKALKGAMVAEGICTKDGDDKWITEMQECGRYSQESY